MPFKTCLNPDCNHVNGPRTKYCHTCGHPYPTTIKKFGGKVEVRVPNKNEQKVVVNNNITFTSRGIPTLSPDFYSNSYGELNLNPGNLFDDLYGKDEAMAIVMSALNVYNQTKGQVRTHVLLHGSPSGGKSEIINQLEKMVGKDSCLRMNAESASKAGMENELLNYPGPLPPLLIAEEIEKSTQPNNLLWMLPALDTRREIIKVTAKNGMERRSVPFICIATCNDLSKLVNMHSGSIASRFAHKVFVRDMEESDLIKVLTNKLKMLPRYDVAWIKPAIDFCRQTGDCSTRRLESVLLCGQDALLDGSFQATLLAASKN